jgi:1-acyl-sn-glycerol-3-phosphate acyltransferase
MKKIIGCILTPLFYLVFALLLCIFHLVQIIAFHGFGKDAHKKAVDVLNFFLLYSLLILGTRISVKFKFIPPTDRPIIFIANHQGMYDIIGIIWFLRKYTPKFVSKIELSKGIPSVSYNLRRSGAALINRNDSKQSITEIARLAKLTADNNYSAVIFPEGTRSKDGTMKGFAAGGMNVLMKKAPNAIVVPIVIKNVWKLRRWGAFPMSVGEHVTWIVLPAIETIGKEKEAIIAEAEEAIKSELFK